MGNTRRETPTPRTLHAEVSNSVNAITNGSFSKNSIPQSNVEYKKKLPRERADAENRTGSNSRGSESSNTSLRDDSSSITPNISNRINIVNQIPDEEEDEKQKKAEQQYTRWMQEAEEAKRVYGDFDLSAELKDPRFRKLLRSGISVPDAYLVTHQGDILIGATRMGLRLGEEKVGRRVEENRRRPRENGLDPGAPFITKPNVAKMTRADRLAIAHRVARGEKIRF